eukprot:jgi/Mesen1/7152/ME000037S06510
MSTKNLRRAWGSFSDSTRVGIAKINSEYKELDVAVVKATNHVETPPKEKHVRTIFAYTSASRPRADVAYCIHALAKRISKTNSWVVALKVLMVIHRTLREGDPTFREELTNYARSRGHMLNLANFKDESGPSAWDYSAWIRTYAQYMEERLECLRVLKYDVESERSSGHSKTRELDTPDLLEHLPALQALLHRLMGCQPEGAAAQNHIVQAALGLVLKESFKLYRAINDGIINLVDKFFEMQRHDAIKALDIYKRAGQQAERLSEFYDICKRLDLARSFQFPALEQPPQSFLATMEEYVRDSRSPAPREAVGDSFEDRRRPPPPVEQREPPPPVVEEPPPPPPPVKQEDADLLGLGHDAPGDPAMMEHNNALALAIVPADGANGHAQAANGMPTDYTTSGWELALVTAPSAMSAPASTGTSVGSKLAGGMDKLTLDSLYEDAVRRTSPYSTPPGSYGGAAAANLHQQQQQQGQGMLALPAPPGAFAQQQQAAFNPDPFLASSRVAPPPSVQMAAMAVQQQQFMVGAGQLGYPQQVGYGQGQVGYGMQQQPYGMSMQPNPFGGNPYAAAQQAQAQYYGMPPQQSQAYPPQATGSANPFLI